MKLIIPIVVLLIIPFIEMVDANETVVEQNFRIEPGEYKSWEFESDGFLTLYINGVSNLWTFSIYLLDEGDYQDLKNDREFDHSAQASTVYNADLTWEIPEGTFYVVVVNEFDNVSVNLELTIEKEERYEDVCCGSILIGSAIVLGTLCALVILLKKRS
jgi:hypothetical protein